MNDLLLAAVEMSVSGAGAALLAWAACALLRRAGAPGRLLCWLWLAVGVRFVLPGGIPVVLPAAKSRPIAAAADAVAQFTAPAASPETVEAVYHTPAPGLTVGLVLAVVWAAGTLGLLVRAAWQYARLRRQVALACKTADGCYSGEGVTTPFTLGILRPRIYLPETLAGEARRTVLLHEKTHIRRRDYIVKPLYYLAACLNWWNPLAWLAYREFERAMETACDEAAVRGLVPGERLNYCETLLHFAVARPVPGSLAFGQGTVSARIAHVLRFRRPGKAALAGCAAMALAVGAGCLCAPVQAAPLPDAEPAVSASVSPADDAAEPEVTEESTAPTFHFITPTYYSYISRYRTAYHNGDDLAAPRNTAVIASEGGTVVTAAYHYSYGNYVVIDHGADAEGHRWRTLYAHLNKIEVEEGDAVAQGTLIGRVGTTGNSTGNHLHLELWRDDTLLSGRDYIDYSDMTLAQAADEWYPPELVEEE